MGSFAIHPSTFRCRAICLSLLLILLAGCGNDPAARQSALDIHKGDTCAVCGMYLDASPGPRGEAYVIGRKTPLKFDSTRDFFAYILQPENQLRLQGLFVQDSGRIDWDHPANTAATFIDARKAFFVAWQPRPGSMGPTLAPYASRAAAEAFVRENGGEVLGFTDITMALATSLDYRCPVHGSPAFPLVRQCRAGKPVDDPLHLKRAGMSAMPAKDADHQHAGAVEE